MLYHRGRSQHSLCQGTPRSCTWYLPVYSSPQCCALSSPDSASAQVSVPSTEVDPEHRQGPVAHSADQLESRIYFPFVHLSVLIKYFFKKAAVLETVPF